MESHLHSPKYLQHQNIRMSKGKARNLDPPDSEEIEDTDHDPYDLGKLDFNSAHSHD